jgi:2-keto-3-deoxy-galactonokinase
VARARPKDAHRGLRDGGARQGWMEAPYATVPCTPITQTIAPECRDRLQVHILAGIRQLHPPDLVLDPFAGSGTILIAAEKTGRRAAAIELTPGYLDIAVRRWQQYTGKTAILTDTGQSFEDLEAERLFTANVTSREAA